MAIRNPFSKAVARKSAEQEALKKAAEERLRREAEAAQEESQTVTHQGPGTGQVPAADPAGSTSILGATGAREDDDSQESSRGSIVGDPRTEAARAGLGTNDTEATQTSTDPDAVDENGNALFKGEGGASTVGRGDVPTSKVEEAVAAAVRARDPFDDIAEGRDPADGSVPNAVSDNNAETLDLGLQGGRESSKKEVEVADSGVDADVKAGPRSRADEFGLGSSTSEGQTGQPGNTAAQVGSGGNQGAIDAVTGEINSAKEQERDVASELLGVPNINPGAGNEGSGQRLSDLQFASAELAIANASATETEPSVAADGATKFAAVVGLPLAVQGAAGAAPIAAAVGTGAEAAGAFIAGALGASSSSVGVVAAADVAVAAGATAAAGAAGVVLAAGIGVGAGLAVNAAFEDEFAALQQGAADALSPVDSTEQTEAKAAEGRKAGEERKAQREREEEAAREKEEAERARAEIEAAEKAQAEADKKAAEDAEKDKGGGVKTTPADDRPTKEEFLLGQQIKAELGQRRIAGDIDFGEGDGTNTGPKTEANLSAADQLIRGGNETLVGQPGAGNEATRPRTGTVPGTPGFGGSDQGGDIDFEDGTGFTGGTRTEDLNDINFGPSAPLVGFPRDDDDDSGKDDD